MNKRFPYIDRLYSQSSLLAGTLALILLEFNTYESSLFEIFPKTFLKPNIIVVFFVVVLKVFLRGSS